jgi:predicted Zn-dependent peptidase
MLEEIILDNGLKLLLFPMEKTEALTILFLTKTGSKYETKNLNGISHLLEHLLFRGTKSWPEPTSIAKELDRVGGFYNAFTDKEMLGVIVKVAPENFVLAAKIVAEMVSQPLLAESEIAKEKKIVIEEINMRQDDPPTLVGDLWERLLYGDQPAGWPVIGAKEVIEKMGRENLISHFKDCFVARNSIIIIAGSFKSPEAEKIIKDSFSRLPGGKGVVKVLVKESQNLPAIELLSKQTDQTHLCLGVRGFNVFSPQKYVLEVIAALLGGMMSSRLFVEIREKRALAYYVKTVAEEYTDSGYLVTQAGIANSRVLEAIEIICHEYRRLKTELVLEDELSRVKENLRGHLRLHLETSEQFATFFGVQKILKDKVMTPQQEWKQIAKVGQDDILKVSKEIFQPERLNLALIGPHHNKDSFVPFLLV